MRAENDWYFGFGLLAKQRAFALTDYVPLNNVQRIKEHLHLQRFVTKFTI
jgi:hypothetical protein